MPSWINRIVDYIAAFPLDQLLAHPRNPKIHPRPQTDAIKGILGEVGWLTGLIYNQRTHRLLDGHDRVKAAMEAGEATAPVFVVDVPEEMEPYVLATFDPVGTLAATDSTILDDLLKEVVTEDSAVQALLDRIAGAPALDPAELWQGMPEFENEHALGWKQLIVHFENREDYYAFGQFVGQVLTDKTKYIWYPPQENLDAKSHRVADES